MAHPSFEPRRNVNYRIQNVDYGTFLERRKTGPVTTTLLMRPLKEVDEQLASAVHFPPFFN
jgi:hypothetical protein